MVTSDNDINNDIQENLIQYNPYRLAELARLAIGARSISEFCDQTQLSKSFVSRILNAKLSSPPAKRTLCRFAGPQANPENGVRLQDMLVAAGYSVSVDTLLSSNDNDESTSTNVVQGDYSESAKFGVDIILNALMESGYGEEYSIEFQPSAFSLKIKQGEFDSRIVCIPAFCSIENSLKAIQVSVLTKLILSMSHYAVETSIFFVMTNNYQLFNELINSFHVIPKMKLAVLLVNKDFRGFSKQEIISSKKTIDNLEDKDIEEFPIVFC